MLFSAENRETASSIPKLLLDNFFFLDQALAALLIHINHFICVAGSFEVGYWKKRYLFKAM